jgi:Ca-activated chloride channel family protein
VIRDEADHLVPDLGPRDVEVFEAGVPRAVVYFRAAKDSEPRVPLSVVLLLDASGSMKEKARDLQEGAMRFVAALEPEDSVLIVDIHTQPVEDGGGFTGEPARLESHLAAMDFWGGTALLDAIGHSIERLQSRPGRKALVVLSDGNDTTSVARFDQVLAQAQASDVTIYAMSRRLTSIALDRNDKIAAPRVLAPLSSETGGDFLELDWATTMAEGCERVVGELHAQYLLAYVPARSSDGLLPGVEITTRTGLKVRARKAFMAGGRPPTG